MQKLFGFLKKVDDNLVKIALYVFVFFIPLWPKLPFANVNYTYIAIRYDDFFVALVALIFLIQLIRRKVKLNPTMLPLFILFWLAVFVSFLYGHYISKTVVILSVGFLNAARRVEYMMIFFAATSVIKNKKDFVNFLNAYLVSVFVVVLYGIGQKFLNFPAVQTMNPEYSKGYLLYLTPDARISGTFAGQYDLASYLVLALPVILATYFQRGKKRLFGLFVLALLVLIYTSSRISFGAYFVTIFALMFFLKKFRVAIVVFVLTVLLVLTTGELTKRFLQTFQVRRILVNEKTGAVYIGQKITTQNLPAGSFYIPLNTISDIVPVAKKTKPTTKNKPADNIAIIKDQLISQKIKEASAAGKKITAKEMQQIEASVSAEINTQLTPVNTVVSDISFATRLQIEWPRAIKAFLKNPVLGAGPSAITEATDNDFLRWLGETGLLGTGLFLFIIFKIVQTIYLAGQKMSKEEMIIGLGFIAGILALLINATYIDVFEASKVAYVFWLMAGVFMGYYTTKISRS